MKLFPRLAFLQLFLLILSIQMISPYQWIGNTLYDLESNTEAGLISEAASWGLSLYRTAGYKVTYCSTDWILGGYCVLGGSYGQYFYKTYTGLPTHNQVNIKVKVYTIDSWDGTGTDDHFEIGIDNNSKYAFRMNGFDPVYSNSNLCGNGGYKDFPPFQTYLSYPHSANTLTFKMISCADEDSCNESLGFRDVIIEFIMAAVPSEAICAISGAPISSNPCPCPDPNMFMYPPNTGNCVYCHASCKTCDAPSASDCTSCADGKYLINGQCLPCSSNCLTCTGSATLCTNCNPGWFMINGVCYSSCNPPLTTETTNGVTYCKSICPVGQYLYWDGTCSSTCPSAYASNAAATGYFALTGNYVNTFLQCIYPCGTSQFLAWNGTCLGSCPSPLTTTAQFHSRNFCDYPCTSGQFLYWNGTCGNTCPLPLAQETQGTSQPRKFCWYYCQPDQFLYWNGTCGNTCPPPLAQETQGTNLPRKFCWYYCQPAQYLYWNGTCGNSCPAPLASELQGTSEQRNFCWYYCQPGEYLYWNGSCIADCPAPLAKETQGTYLPRQFCWYYCQPDEFLYWNGTCGSTCPFPLAQETQGTYLPRKFCWYYCQPNEYLYWNGSCIADCPEPLAKELQGTYLQRQFCWYYCQPSDYLYWNGSCLSQCPIPLTIEVQGSVGFRRNFCWYTCQPNEYLLWNQTCLADCPFPLQPELQGSYLQRNFCWYLCPVNQHLYWNGSCMDTCPLPLTSALQGTFLPRYFCIYHCVDTEFLYWNQSCSSQCPFPLTNELQGVVLPRKFCWYPCMPWQWLTWDQNCKDSCVFPVVAETQGINLPRQFCWFPCTSESQFLYWNGTCLAECPKPLVSRYSNGQWFCDYLCGVNQYLYWNGSCLSSCVSPLWEISEGNPLRNFCYYPCQVEEYLYWDGSCQTSCDFPLVTEAQGSPKRQFCWYRCAVGDYLYWDGTCSGSCDPPYAKRNTIGRRFCDYECLDGQYLAWNSSCLDTCPYPLVVRIEGTLYKKNYCDYPCLSTQYLYWNGSCFGTCDAPLVARTEGSPTQKMFCDYPCVGNQYLYWNGTCSSKCNSPLVVRIVKDNRFCDFSCAAGQILYWDGTCGTSCSAPLTLISEGDPSVIRRYCQYQCKVTQFLYWNGSCGDACNFPLTSYVEKGRLFCKYTCLGGEYLYSNGSCIGDCNTPFVSRVENGFKFCDYSCADSFFLYWNGSCLAICEYPFIQRTTNNNLYCDFPCTTGTDFLYWNGTCSSQCPYPLSQVNEGVSVVRKFCSFGCNAGEYLYWNQTCSDKCNFPLAKVAYGGGTESFCYYPCDVNEHLYWNGSCLSACSFPLKLRFDTNQHKYCDYPCKYSYLYLYWNGSCIPDCKFPLSSRTNDGKLFCEYSCGVSEYLYWNSSCSSECNPPFISKNEGSRKYCQHPCHPSDYFFWNISCLPSCPFPLISKTDNFQRSCHPPCSNSLQYYYPNLKACYDECHQPAIISSDEGYLMCSVLESTLMTSSHGDFWRNAPVEHNSVTIVNLAKNMHYVKYLGIEMPPRLQRLSLSQGRNLFSFSSGIKMSDNMQKNFDKQELSSVYARHQNLHSSFLVNYWEDLMTMVIAFLIGLGFLLFERLSRALDWKFGEIIGHTIQILIKWNYILMIFASSFDHIILFSALEFQSFVANSSAFSNLSLTSSLTAILSMVTLITLTCYSVLKKKQKGVTNQVIFRGFKGNSLFSQLFFIIYMSRIAITTLVSVCFKVSPLMISILEIIISAGMIACLVIKKPFVKRINQYQMIFFEVMTALMNLGMFVLAILSDNNKSLSNSAIVIADLVIIGNDIINASCLFFLVIKLHLEIKILRRFVRDNSLKGPEVAGLWLQLLFVPMQLAHMGFEEMVVYDIKQATGSLRFRGQKAGKTQPQPEVKESVFDVSFDRCDNIRHQTEDGPLNSERKKLRIDEEENNNSIAGGYEVQGDPHIEMEVPKNHAKKIEELDNDQALRSLKKNPSHSSLRIKSRFAKGAENNNNINMKSLKFSSQIRQENVFSIKEGKERLDLSDDQLVTSSLSLSSFQYDPKNLIKERGFDNAVMDTEDFGLSYSERRIYENEKMEKFETLETVERIELKTEENNETLKTEEASLNREVRRWKKKENSSQILSEKKSVEELVRPPPQNENENIWKGVQTLFKSKSKWSHK